MWLKFRVEVQADYSAQTFKYRIFFAKNLFFVNETFFSMLLFDFDWRFFRRTRMKLKLHRLTSVKFLHFKILNEDKDVTK